MNEKGSDKTDVITELQIEVRRVMQMCYATEDAVLTAKLMQAVAQLKQEIEQSLQAAGLDPGEKLRVPEYCDLVGYAPETILPPSDPEVLIIVRGAIKNGLREFVADNSLQLH